jgi:Leucine-rich repeat (LRR) protein
MNQFLITLLLVIISLELTLSQLSQSPHPFSTVCQSGIREDNTNYIYCARRGLTQIPLFNRNNVVYDELVLTDNRIESLEANAFARIKVKKIYLNGNPIKSINSKAFNRLENHLEELWLDADLMDPNQLMNPHFLPTSTDDGSDVSDEDSNIMLGIPKPILKNLRNLNTLRLKGFMVSKLTNSTFDRLNRIEILSLKFCFIETIESHAFDGIKSLKELYLDGNLLQFIPTSALLHDTFKSLRILSLSQNNIKTISSQSFGIRPSMILFNSNEETYLESLEILDLSYNGLRVIEAEAFSCLNRTLDTLLLQNNELTSFHLWFIRHLPALRELNLDFNVITQLDSHIFQLSNKLESLTIQGNSLTFKADPEDSSILAGLVHLQSLNLARNGIKQIPRGLFTPMQQLRSLSLDKNPIESFQRYTFAGIGNTLQNLSLQSTQMKSKDLISLSEMKVLEKVKLGHNNIDIIDWSIFSEMHSTLTNLDIQNNEITEIVLQSQNALLQMNNLVELDVSSNRLCEFNSNLLKMMPNVKNLGLSQNPLYCDCTLLPLYHWTIKRYDKDILPFIQWQCSIVPALLFDSTSKKQFTSLKESQFICPNDINKGITKCGRPIEPISTSKTTLQTTTETILNRKPRITNIQLLNKDKSVLVKWTLDIDNQQDSYKDIKGFKITTTESTDSTKPFKFLADKFERQFRLENLKSSTKYKICINILLIDSPSHYDKYCREVYTATTTQNENEIKLSTRTISPIISSAKNETSNQSDILSSLMVTVLVILAILIVGLIVFIAFYVRSCRHLSHVKKKAAAANALANCSKSDTTISSSPLGLSNILTTTAMLNSTMHPHHAYTLANNNNHQFIAAALNNNCQEMNGYCPCETLARLTNTNRLDIVNCLPPPSSSTIKNTKKNKNDSSSSSSSTSSSSSSSSTSSASPQSTSTSTTSTTCCNNSNFMSKGNIIPLLNNNDDDNDQQVRSTNTLLQALSPRMKIHRNSALIVDSIDNHHHVSSSPTSFTHFIPQSNINSQQQQQKYISLGFMPQDFFNNNNNVPNYNDSNNIDHVYCEIPSSNNNQIYRSINSNNNNNNGMFASAHPILLQQNGNFRMQPSSYQQQQQQHVANYHHHHNLQLLQQKQFLQQELKQKQDNKRTNTISNTNNKSSNSFNPSII